MDKNSQTKSGWWDNQLWRAQSNFSKVDKFSTWLGKIIELARTGQPNHSNGEEVLEYIEEDYSIILNKPIGFIEGRISFQGFLKLIKGEWDNQLEWANGVTQGQDIDGLIWPIRTPKYRRALNWWDQYGAWWAWSAPIAFKELYVPTIWIYLARPKKLIGIEYRGDCDCLEGWTRLCGMLCR